MKKAFSILVDILTSIVLIVALAMVIPWLFGVQPKVVLTGSMEPNLPVGSLVYVVPVSAEEDLAVGDIITYPGVEGGKDVTHRVNRIETEEGIKKFYTKGDANEDEDGPPQLFGNILGTVEVFVPIIGYALALLLTTSGKVIAATICVILVILFFLLGGDPKEKGEKKEKKELWIELPGEEQAQVNAEPVKETRWPLPQVRAQAENKRK
ncbi:MAG: signal peptidase I [Clostridiales bacterium]|nr:signal peptidase I [Clostridiales bacterium]